MTASLVIVAAGQGARMGAGRNKAFLEIDGRPLLQHTLLAFVEVHEVDDLVVVAHPRELDEVAALTRAVYPRFRVVPGGSTRRDSALAGVRAAGGDVVLIHDGARPFPSVACIRRVLAAAGEADAAVPVVPISDLLHEIGPGDWIERAPGAAHAPWASAQTPQGFRRELILRCLEAAPPSIRDDATAVLLAGQPVRAVPGEPTNLKVTRPEDVALAEAIAQSRRSR